MTRLHDIETCFFCKGQRRRMKGLKIIITAMILVGIFGIWVGLVYSLGGK
jgi:hypothetical protein